MRMAKILALGESGGKRFRRFWRPRLGKAAIHGLVGVRCKKAPPSFAKNAKEGRGTLGRVISGRSKFTCAAEHTVGLRVTIGKAWGIYCFEETSHIRWVAVCAAASPGGGIAGR
jgi:hypothetical protein